MLYILVGVLILVVILFALLVIFQEKLVYVPVLPGEPRAYSSRPADYGMTAEDVTLTASDGVKLHSWLIKHRRKIAGPTLLFLQENAGNISHRLIPIQYLMDRLECNVFMLSYRGYGESEGTPSEKGLRADAQAALDHLLTREDIDPKTVFAFGRSLGGAVAAQLVHDNPGKLRGLILENTFTSIIDMVGKMFPFLRHVVGAGKPLNFLVRSKWHTLGIIGDIQEPVLLLSGSLDEMVPPHHMKELHRAASNAKLVEFEQGMHMDTWLKGGKRYWQEMDDFINVAGSPRQAVGERGLRRRVTGEPGSSAGPARRVEASEQKDMGFETVKNDKTFSSVVD